MQLPSFRVQSVSISPELFVSQQQRGMIDEAQERPRFCKVICSAWAFHTTFRSWPHDRFAEICRVRKTVTKAADAVGTQSKPRHSRTRWKHLRSGILRHCGSRCLVQAILEDKRGDTLFRQRAGDVPAFIFHGQGEETSAGCHDNGGAACLGWIRKKGRQRRNRHIARELAAVLPMPGLRVRRTGQRTGAEFDRVGLRRRGDGCHPVVLRMRRQCKPSDRRKQSDCQTKMGWPRESSLRPEI